MKQICYTILRFLTLSTTAAVATQLRAAEPVKVHWADLCRVSSGNELLLTMTDGSAEGYCTTVTAREVTIETLDHKIVRVGRSAITYIRMQSPKGHNLQSLGRGMQRSLREGVKNLFSPAAPLGLIAIPATLAWGAVAAPFCAVGDLVTGSPGPQDIQII